MNEQSSLNSAVDEPIEVRDYNPLWPTLFEDERQAIRSVLPGVFEDIQHIGSTAVPGPRAKPIIDILGGIEAHQNPEQFSVPLSRLGYVPATAFSTTITDHTWFMRWSGGRRTHQFHVLVFGGIEWRRRIAFRDALRSKPGLAEEYSKLKIELAQKHRHDRAAYTHGKSQFVLRVASEA